MSSGSPILSLACSNTAIHPTLKRIISKSDLQIWTSNRCQQNYANQHMLLGRAPSLSRPHRNTNLWGWSTSSTSKRSRQAIQSSSDTFAAYIKQWSMLKGRGGNSKKLHRNKQRQLTNEHSTEIKEHSKHFPVLNIMPVVCFSFYLHIRIN